MGGELMSTRESAFRVHHLLCYKASQTFFFHLFPDYPLLLFFRHFSFVQHFLPISFFFFFVVTLIFFSLHNGTECMAVLYVYIILQILSENAVILLQFICKVAGLCEVCVNCYWFIIVFDGSQAGLGENKWALGQQDNEGLPKFQLFFFLNIMWWNAQKHSGTVSTPGKMAALVYCLLKNNTLNVSNFSDKQKKCKWVHWYGAGTRVMYAGLKSSPGGVVNTPSLMTPQAKTFNHGSSP